MTDIPLPRIAVPPSIRVQHESNLNRNSPFGQSPSSPRPLPFSRHSGPMSIPRAREDVPPPLPPPRLIDMSNDLGWKFGNRDEHTSFGRHDFLPINPSSSLCGGMQRDYDGRDEEMGRPPFVRRSSSQSTVNQHSEGDYKQELPHFADEGYHSLSGSSIGAYPLVPPGFIRHLFAAQIIIMAAFLWTIWNFLAATVSRGLHNFYLPQSSMV
ncbi:MAG: hypothetical protein M1834_004541 [Cirrosporium novae-zelandiae]|nr:MAG: hypothetical protein M1834_004541 [Cirrosporium novae-zelandiae]